MILKSVIISNYRSITSSERINFENYNVLIGKNNEGKTNVLNALNLLFETLKNPRFRSNSRLFPTSPYNYEIDFPLHLQGANDEIKTWFEMEMNLTEEEKNDFKRKLGISNNGTLKLEITYEGSETSIRFLGKKGNGAISYEKNKNEIIQFITDHFDFVYIPTIRTSENSLRIIQDIVSKELRSLEQEEVYNKALNTVREYEQTRLNHIAEQIKNPIKGFLPQLKDTKISINYDNRYSSFRRDIKFLIDDGNLTDISTKGEGVKSIITLALLQSFHTSNDKSRIIAIEEPESHLHPEAIHQISYVLRQLAQTSQVIISTHNPIFVNSQNIHTNLIVDRGEVKMANSLNEIRDTLGSRLSDSLLLSDNVIIVEGEEDRDALEHIIKLMDGSISAAFENKRIMFQVLNGANKLSYHLSLLKSFIINYVVVLDGDEAGKSAYNEANAKLLLSSKQVVFFSCNNDCHSEFENMLSDTFLHDILMDYGYDNSINVNGFKKLNWSARMKRIFNSKGLIWDDNVERKIKREIVTKISKQSNLNFIKPSSLPILESLMILIKSIL